MAERDTIRKFFSYEEAQSFAELLTRHGIACEVKKFRPLVDTIIAGDDQEHTFNVLIAPADFSKANTLLDGIVAEKLNELPDDYYLYQFSNDELKDLLSKADEWSNQDVQLARKLLNERGAGLSDEAVGDLKTKRYAELATPATIDNLTLIAIYFLAVFFSPISLFLSLFYLNTKTTLPDGNKVFGYDEKCRNHAKATLTISALMMVLLVVSIAVKG